MQPEEDIVIIHQVLQGDQNAYRLIVDKHKYHVLNLIYRIVGNREEAEDLAQDVFVKVYQKLGSFKEQSKFSTWLYRIAYNEAVSTMRKRKVEWTEINEVNAIAHDEAFFDDYENTDELKAHYLPRALKELNADDQLLISLYYQQMLSVSDIEAVVGLSQSNIKIRLYRARKSLHSIISNYILNHQLQPNG